jgi:hypothetical protein
MSKRDEFDDRSKNSHEDRHKDQYEDKGGSTKNDYNGKEDGSFSEGTVGDACRQQPEDIDETNRIERLKKD